MALLPDGRRCPTHRKRAYVTEAEAWDHLAADFPDDLDMAPYVCYCGSIHIGHSPQAGRARRGDA